MQVARIAIVLALSPQLARGDGDVTATASVAPAPDDLDVRLTLSSFLYRQSGNDAEPLVDQGASPQNASPVHRWFGDMRFELTDDGFAADARVRETTSEDYQSGADGGGEYELRTLDYRLGSRTTYLTLGRQYIDAVGETKIDGASLTQRFGAALAGTMFVGAFPELGSRSLDTDYVHFVNNDGTTGPLIVPVAAGLGLAYQTASYHGDVGAAGVYVPEDIPDAPSDQKSRIYTTSSGYWRPSSALDIYHFALLDLAGADGVDLVNGSLGIDARPIEGLQLSFAGNHVSSDLLQIVARNYLSDPDPSALGVVQNNIALLRISSDAVRAGASVSLAAQRFELSASGGFHRRPAVSVALADGSGSVVFPEVESADATFTVLDRRSLAKLRLALSGSVIEPLGGAVPNRSRGTVARLVASRTFADQRGQIDADVMVERFRDVGAAQECATSQNALACYGTSTTSAAQAGAVVSWRVAREWLVVADTHVGYQKVGSTFVYPMDPTDPGSMAIATPVHWPGVVSVTAFARVQWRFR
ncbi:MAG TPA: hypothetical protein VLX92_09045 [Kofleriaceae bacterium]|nr:hypothetical protein [Kofleriaceae bacterium]